MSSGKPKTCAEKLEIHAERIRKIQLDESHPDHHFYSLIRPYSKPKKRPCLRCRKIFNSSKIGDRVCASCESVKVGAAALTYL
jgi:hypothetical protein